MLGRSLRSLISWTLAVRLSNKEGACCLDPIELVLEDFIGLSFYPETVARER